MTTTSIICGDLSISGNFDSGNILKAELVEPSPLPQTQTDEEEQQQNDSSTSPRTPRAAYQPLNHDYEINVWTRPDCYGSEWENGNRTWFHFGINGGKPNGVVKINIVNLNKQSKLFMQGMAPVIRIIPEKPNWERAKDRIVLNENRVVENSCSISFRQKLPEYPEKSTLYIAFTYPFSYLELSDLLISLDSQFPTKSSTNPISANPPSTRQKKRRELLANTSENDIYYHRECVCFSLEGRRVDLITITSIHGISEKREDRLKNLFPIQEELRPFKFPGKKVVFLSARVHPGETPSSFVINGTLRFILDKTDPRALILRRLFVFKIVPILNPDGVSNGHYRTDPRGVNLNRVYLNPSSKLHPSIYAARKLLIYYHSGVDSLDDFGLDDSEATGSQENVGKSLELNCKSSSFVSIKSNSNSMKCEGHCSESNSGIPMQVDEGQSSSSSSNSIAENHSSLKKPYTFVLSDANSLCAGCVPFDDESAQMPKSVEETQHRSDPLNESAASTHQCAFEACDEDSVFYENLKLSESLGINNMEVDDGRDTNGNEQTSSRPSSPRRKKKDKKTKKGPKALSLNELAKSKIVGRGSRAKRSMKEENFPLDSPIWLDRNSRSFPSIPKPLRGNGSGYKSGNSRYYDSTSGLFLYVDMHGHTTKRGIFMYGNHFSDIDTQAECMLVPRIMAINSHHFDFAACNFTERLMCVKDRKDGASREGSGRVACLKLTGLIRSYTLECNYNTGRIVNQLVSRPATCGFIDPLDPALFQPPKFTIDIFESVGKALGETILDMTGQNPWSRLTLTEYKTLEGIKRSLISRLRLSPEFKVNSTASSTGVNQSFEGVKKGQNIFDGNRVLESSNKLTKRPKAKILTPFQPSGPLGPRRENQNTTAKASGSQTLLKKLTEVDSKKSLSKGSSEDSVPSTSSNSCLPKSNLTKVTKKKSFPKFTSAKRAVKKKSTKHTEKSDVLLPK